MSLTLCATTAGLAKHGGGSPSRTGANASPIASNAAREIRSHLSVFSTILRIYRVGTLPVALTSAA